MGHVLALAGKKQAEDTDTGSPRMGFGRFPMYCIWMRLASMTEFSRPPHSDPSRNASSRRFLQMLQTVLLLFCAAREHREGGSAFGGAHATEGCETHVETDDNNGYRAGARLRRLHREADEASILPRMLHVICDLQPRLRCAAGVPSNILSKGNGWTMANDARTWLACSRRLFEF
jgi:hypothetical protein